LSASPRSRLERVKPTDLCGAKMRWPLNRVGGAKASALCAFVRPDDKEQSVRTGRSSQVAQGAGQGFGRIRQICLHNNLFLTTFPLHLLIRLSRREAVRYHKYCKQVDDRSDVDDVKFCAGVMFYLFCVFLPCSHSFLFPLALGRFVA